MSRVAIGGPEQIAGALAPSKGPRFRRIEVTNPQRLLRTLAGGDDHVASVSRESEALDRFRYRVDVEVDWFFGSGLVFSHYIG
jgi:hypothetical protein